MTVKSLHTTREGLEVESVNIYTFRYKIAVECYNIVQAAMSCHVSIQVVRSQPLQPRQSNTTSIALLSLRLFLGWPIPLRLTG